MNECDVWGGRGRQRRGRGEEERGKAGERGRGSREVEIKERLRKGRERRDSWCCEDIASLS